MRSLRVLLVTQQLAAVRSGVGTYARLLARRLPDLGAEVAVLTPDGGLPGVETVALPRGLPIDPTPGGSWSLARKAGAFLRTVARGGRRDFDLVHFTDAREALHVPDRFPIPVVGTAHDDYALASPRGIGALRKVSADPIRRALYYAWLRRVEPVAYGKLSALIVNAESVGRSLSFGYGIPRHRMTVVRIGVDPPPAGLEPLPLAGEPSVLFVGGNFFRKGLPALVAAAASLVPRFPAIRVHVVGADRNARAARRRARAAGVRWDELVTILGPRNPEETRRAMAGATCLALPARTEAFGLALLEAMSVGTPVIGSRAGGSREIVEDGRSGFLVEPGDERALADAIERLATEPMLRARFAAEGRATAARFAPERTAEETLGVYRAVLGFASAPRRTPVRA